MREKGGKGGRKAEERIDHGWEIENCAISVVIVVANVNTISYFVRGQGEFVFSLEGRTSSCTQESRSLYGM